MTNSTITEERVVGLRFDNKDFAKSVRNTMSLLDRLHYSVDNLKGAGNSVLFFANQIKSITFDPLARGCQMGIGKIMALTAALTGVSNVADEVYHKMTTLIKSMSTDQISAGWEKYADYTSSIQTIMSATKQEGETDAEAMARVNREMEKLLWFTDETSYNLTDMTSNIGKFTSQGIGLEESVTAMQGIALWAAAAGQKSAEASRVMYNLSQAMGTGYVQLIDWTSVENASMATKEFKELAIKAGLAEGTLKKVGSEIQTLEGNIVTVENLRNTLQDKWLTTDKVLMRVLKEYGSYASKVREYQSANGLDTASEAIEKLKEDGVALEDQIGQAAFEAGQAAITFADTIGSVKDAVSTQFLRIFQAIFGNYLKAKKLWTTFANELWTVFAGPVNEIAIALERFAETGAIEKTWSELYELWKSIYKVFEEIDNTFKDVFPYVGVYIKNFLDGTQKISKTLTSFINNKVLGNEKIWSNLKTFFEGVKSSLNIIKNLLDTIYNRILSKFTGKTDSFLEAISNIAAKIGDILIKADAYIQKTDLFNNFFDNIERVVNNVLEGIKQIKKVLSDAIEKATTKFFPQDTKFDATIETLTAFDNAADLVISGINGIVDALTLAIPWFVRFWYWIKNTFSDAKKFFGTLGGMIKAVFDEIKRILEPIFGEVGNIFDELSRNFSIAELFNNSQNPIDFFNKLIEKLKEFSGVTNEYLLDLFANTKADNAFKKIVAILVDNITFLLDELEPLMPRILKLNEQLFKTDSIFATIKLIAENVFATIVFFNILKMLFSKQKVEQVSQDQSVSTVFSSGNWVIDLINFIPNITNLLKAIKNLVNPFEKLGEDMKRAAKSIMIFGIVSSIVASLGIMVAAIVAIAVMPWKKVILALFVITTLEAGIFGIFAVMNKIANNKNFDAKSVLAFGAFMTLFATAMLEMAAAVAIIATIQNDDNVGIAGAVFGLSVLLAGMATIMMLLADAAKNEGQMISAGVAVVLLAKAVKTIASAMVKISHIEEDKLAQSSIVILALVGLMGILEILAAAIKKQQGGTGAIMVMGISCVAMAGSILVAAFAMKKIADIPLDQLKTAGIAMGIIFAALSAFVVGASGLAKLLTSGNKGTTGTLVVLTVMVGVMAGIMTAIGAALATITKNAATSGKIWTAALAIATLMGAVSIVLLLGANMNKANIGAVAAFGGIITAVLISVAAVGLALGKLAKDVDPASLWNTVGAMAAIMGAVMLIVGVAAFVIQAVGKTSFGKGFIGALFAVAGIIAIIITAFAFLAYSASRLMDSIMALSELSSEASARLTAAGGAIVTAMQAIISAIIEGLDKALTNMLHKTKIPDAFARFMEKILMAVTGLIPKIKAFIKRVVTEISDYVRENHTMIKELIQTILDDILDLILDLFEKYWPRITSDAERFLNDIFFRIDRIFDRWTPIIVEDLLNISKAILSVIMQTKIGIVNNVINGILYLLIRLKAFSFQFALMAMEVVHRFTIGFLTSVREKAPEILEELAVTIITIINALADVIDKHHQEFKDAITRLMNSIYSAFSSWFTDADTPGGKLFRIGYNIVAGIMKGLNSGKQMLTTAISNLANNGIIKTFTDKDHLDMHSPSKVFEGFGQYIVDGLVNGITKNQGAVSNVLSNLGGIVKNSFTDTFGDPKDILSNLGNGLMNGITGLISQKFNLNGLLGDMNGISIVLTPELDLSTLESQAGGISSMFGQQQIDAVVGSFSTPDTGMDSVTMTNKMDEMMQKMEDFAMAQSYNTQTTDVKVTLEGDAKKMLKVLKTESQKQSLASGVPSTI